MARFKHTPHTRHSTPTSFKPHIYAHTTHSRHKPRHQRHFDLKQKHGSMLRHREDDSEDTYLSLLRSIHDTDGDDNESSDGTDINSSGELGGEDQLEGWDEETALVEMLGSPYSMPFSLYYTRIFAHQRVYSQYDEEHILQSLSRGFADASHSLREETVLGLRPVLKSIRDIRPAPGRSFITGLLGFDDACKHFESSHRNAELDAAYERIEVSHRHSLTFSC